MIRSRSRGFGSAGIRPLLLLLFVTLLPASSQASDFKIAKAWVTTPVQWENPSAYFVIQNQGSKVRTIVGGRCKGCDWIEIHRTVFKDGAMTSEKLEQMAIPAGGSVAFVPRGLFLSLIGLTAIESGAPFSLEIEFADGEKLEIEATIGEP